MIPRALVPADPALLPTGAVDVLVVGSGVAGLGLVLQPPARYSVVLATKGRLGQSTAEGTFLVDLFSDGSAGGRGAVTGALLAGAGGLRAMRAPGARWRLWQAMTRNAGVLRSTRGLARAAAVAAGLAGAATDAGSAAFKTANLAQLALALSELAGQRAESRGAHWRADHPEPDPAWQVRQAVWRQPDGTLGTASVPLADGRERAAVAATSRRPA